MDEAENLCHVRVALLHEADALRSPETRGGGLITLAPAFEFVEGPIWPHFGVLIGEAAKSPSRIVLAPPSDGHGHV